jgi:hypothetical protein
MTMLTRTRFAALALLLGAGTLAYAAIRPTAPTQEPAQPTDEHKMLVKAVGDWEGKLVMEVPGAPAQEFPTKETIVAIGSLWTQSKFECDFMGKPFVGSGTTGYDPAKKKFVGTWIDSMTTEMSVMEGEMDPKTKALVMRWEAPGMGTTERVPHRMETVFSADGAAYTSTMFQGEGEGQKTFAIEMKRKAKKADKAGVSK